MDRSWMDLPRLMDAYKEGVQLFLDFAVSNSHDGLILCPCIGCKNGISRERKSVETHLITKDFVKGYTKWVLHGESISESVDSFVDTMDTTDYMWELLHDRFPLCDEDPQECTSPTENEAPNEEAEKFYRLLKDVEQELYPGCKDFSKLSFLVRLLQIKALGNWSDKSFSMLLDLLRESFPQGVQLPKNYYESRKTLRDLGLNYQKIDSCTNDCMIYWGVDESKTSCDTCGESRWKKVQNAEIPGIDHSINKTKETKVPNKSFWYFPLKPRLQRLFMSSKIASQMQWHAKERTDDGIMRHPADSPAWQTFDHNHSDFAKEPRNVRLGLFADGFSPFRTMMVNHSTWPVVLMPYNLPPGECMKKSFFMLSTLIPGPNEPGNNIDVYLEPLIMELKELWDVGINTYDASQKQNFQMRAALMWTISDLPGLANLSGWSTKGKYACPVCMKHTNSEYLKNSHKQCYMGHISGPEKAAHVSGPEKSARMSSVEKSAHISTSEKSARMSSAEKSSHISAPEKSVRMSSAEKSFHISAPEKSSRISAPEKSAFHGSPSESALPPNANFLQVGRKVILKALVGNDIIGKGFVESMDPSKIVGKEELGPDWCEVKVIVAMKPEQRLLRTNGNVKVIGKAIGSSIAWPQHLVQVERPS